MAARWHVIDALLGGTPAMRAAGERLMPRFPAEELETYTKRVAVSTLFPAFRRTADVLSGKPFAKALTIGEDVPSSLRELADDIDMRGNSLHVFAAKVFKQSGIEYGFGGILVDYPRVSGLKTQADEQKAGARPYMVHISHKRILGWQTEEKNGALRLTQLRISEARTEPNGRFGKSVVPRVLVLEPGRWEVWEQHGDKAEFIQVEEGVTSLDEIPFVFVLGEQTGDFQASPPLLDLAYLNVKHWQSQSDQDNILHVARVPILFAAGFPDDKQIVIGANAVKADSHEARLEWVEHSGAAIEAGRNSLQDLEQQMIQTGAELLVKTPGDRSATEASNDAEANKSQLQRMAEDFEDSLDRALQFMAEYLRQPEGGHVSLYKDFGAATLSDASAQLIVSMQQGGLITKRTAIVEQQRRGMLAGDIDPEAELAAVAEEGPSLGTLGVGPGSDGGEDEADLLAA